MLWLLRSRYRSLPEILCGKYAHWCLQYMYHVRIYLDFWLYFDWTFELSHFSDRKLRNYIDFQPSYTRLLYILHSYVIPFERSELLASRSTNTAISVLFGRGSTQPKMAFDFLPTTLLLVLSMCVCQVVSNIMSILAFNFKLCSLRVWLCCLSTLVFTLSFHGTLGLWY